MQALSGHTRLCPTAQQARRRSRCSKGQEKVSTAAPPADGFLTASFLPKFAPLAGGSLPLSGSMERDLLQSLSYLTNCYSISTVNIADKQYPYNILLAHWDLNREIRKLNSDMEMVVTMNDAGRYCFAIEERVSTSGILFFIPVLPLYRLLEDKSKSHCGGLLLSAYAYFFQKVHIPYYRLPDTYMHYQYKMVEEWATENKDEWGEEELLDNDREIDAAARFGDAIGRKIHSPYQLALFEKRLKAFRAATAFDEECLSVAATLFNLMRKFPDRSVFDNMEVREGCDDDEDEVITPEMYISFVTDTKGWLHETAMLNINEAFGEYNDTIEPVRRIFFDKPVACSGSMLDFEKGILDAISDLYKLLKEI